MNDIVPVVAGVVVKEKTRGRPYMVLLHRKDEAHDEEGIPRNPELVGRWEFPGGMMKHGEQPEQTLVRELKEETGLTIKDPKLFYAQTNIYDDGVHYLVLFYLCHTEENITPKGCGYFMPQTIAELDCLPGTFEVVSRLTK